MLKMFQTNTFILLFVNVNINYINNVNIHSAMFSVQCGVCGGCSAFVTRVQHSYADIVTFLALPRPLFFSLSIKANCIDEARTLSIRDQLHTKWRVQAGKKVNGNEFVSCPLKLGPAIMKKH